MSAPQRARKRRLPPRNALAAQPLAPVSTPPADAASASALQSQVVLPSITLGQLKLLAAGGARIGATIRAVEGGYRIEVDLGPRRWQLSSTHDERARLFRHLNGAANAARELGAQQVRLELSAPQARRAPLTRRS